MSIGKALSSAWDVDWASSPADRRRRTATAAQTAARVREAQADAGGPRPGGEESAGGHHVTRGGPATAAPMSGACCRVGATCVASGLCAANAHRGQELVAESAAGATPKAVTKEWLCAATVSWATSRNTPPRTARNRRPRRLGRAARTSEPGRLCSVCWRETVTARWGTRPPYVWLLHRQG